MFTEISVTIKNYEIILSAIIDAYVSGGNFGRMSLFNRAFKALGIRPALGVEPTVANRSSINAV